MSFQNLIAVTVLIALLFSPSVSVAQIPQTDAQIAAAKKKKEIDERVIEMLDASVNEAASLRLSGNRAVVLALIGDLYWRYDINRSRELFRYSATEIIRHNEDYEREKRDGPVSSNMEFSDPNDPRVEILSLVGNRDPELALEFLAPTRSASLVEAMTKAPVTNQSAGLGSGSGLGSGVGTRIGESNGAGNFDRQRVDQEIALEQRFITMSALSDSEKAIKTIKESLAKSISPSITSLLNTVYLKDEKKAFELSIDVIRKIVGTDLTKNASDLNAVVSILQFASRPIPTTTGKLTYFSYSDTQTKEIANKLASTFLQAVSTPSMTSALPRALPLLEKVLPEKLTLLKQRDLQNRKNNSASNNTQGPARYYDQNTPPEEIIAMAAKLSNERDKAVAYQALSARVGQITDDARAKKLISQITDPKIRSTVAEQYESVRISRLTATDKLDEARGAINAITDKRIRLQRLAALAFQFHRKGGEINRENAAGLMLEAKQQTNPFPDDEDELADLMEVVKGYAVVEPDTAFQLFEPVIYQFNEIIQAAAVLSKYNKRDRSFKKGELIMRVNGNIGGGLLAFRYIQQMQLLATADFERMSVLSDKFQRSDSRMIIKLFILQGYLRNVPVSSGVRPS